MCVHNVFLDKLAELCVYLSFHFSFFLYVALREKTCGETLIPAKYESLVTSNKLGSTIPVRIVLATWAPTRTDPSVSKIVASIQACLKVSTCRVSNKTLVGAHLVNKAGNLQLLEILFFVPPKIVSAHPNVICCTQLRFN